MMAYDNVGRCSHVVIVIVVILEYVNMQFNNKLVGNTPPFL